MTYLGAPAIAQACHVQPKTVYGWARAAARGELAPLRVRKTASGRLWCTSEDVHGFYNPPQAKRDRIGLEVEKHLDWLDEHLATRERRCHRSTSGNSPCPGAKAMGQSSVTTARQREPEQLDPILGVPAP